jgi:hypothetical protein
MEANKKKSHLCLQKAKQNICTPMKPLRSVIFHALSERQDEQRHSNYAKLIAFLRILSEGHKTNSK